MVPLSVERVVWNEPPKLRSFDVLDVFHGRPLGAVVLPPFATCSRPCRCQAARSLERPDLAAVRGFAPADVRLRERVLHQPGSAALVTANAAPDQRASSSKNRKQINERPSALGSSSAGVLAAGGGSVTVLMPNLAVMNVLMTSCRGRCQ